MILNDWPSQEESTLPMHRLLTRSLLLTLATLTACQGAAPSSTQGVATRPAATIVASSPTAAPPATVPVTVRPAATPLITAAVTRSAPGAPTADVPTPVAAGTPSGVVYAIATPPADWQTRAVSLASGVTYAISAPPGWRIESPQTPAGGMAAPTMLFSYPASAAGPGGAPVDPKQTKVDIVPLAGQEGKTLAEIVAATTGGPGTTLAGVWAVTVNGIPATRVELDTPLGRTAAVFLLLDRQPLVLQGYGDLEGFNAVLPTFRRVR